MLLDETRPLTVLEGAELRRRWEAAGHPVGILRCEQKVTAAELEEVKARWEKAMGGPVRVIHDATPSRSRWSRVLRWFA